MARAVLVTGASGFIGRSIVPLLADAGWEVHALSRTGEPAPHPGVTPHTADLLDPPAAARVVAAAAPSHLLHLAWYASPGRFWSSEENVEWVEASLRLMREFAAARGRHAVVAGTCAEYQWGGDAPLSETGTPCRPGSLYGTCKNALREVATAHAGRAGYTLAWSRIFHPFGPGEHPDRLVPSVVRGLLSGSPVELSHGHQRRDFVYVDDLAAALVRLLDAEIEGSVNIGTGTPVSLRALVERIGEHTGGADLLRFGVRPVPDHDPAVVVADTARLRGELGWAPATSLDEGVARTVSWWRRELDS